MTNFYYVLKPTRVWKRDSDEKDVRKAFTDFRLQAMKAEIPESKLEEMGKSILKGFHERSYLNYRILAITDNIQDALKVRQYWLEDNYVFEDDEEICIYNGMGEKYEFENK